MNNKVYCIICGAENKTGDKFCNKCGESLHQQDTELKDYLTEKAKDKATDEIKGKATDTFLNWLQKLLNSKAYGIILSLSVVASTTTILAGGSAGSAANINEFSNNTPGVFVDGQLLNAPRFNGYQSSLSNVFGDYDALIYDETAAYGENARERYYIVLTPARNNPVTVKVTEPNGNILLEKTVYNKSNTLNSQTFMIPKQECTIEFLYPESDNDYAVARTVNYMRSPEGVASLEKFDHDGDLLYYAELYPNHKPKYFKIYDQENYNGPSADGFVEFRYLETIPEIYNTPNPLDVFVLEREVLYNYNGVAEYEYRRIERTYSDTLTTETRWDDGVLTYYKETDSVIHREILSIRYDENGAEASRVITEYRDNGVKSKETRIFPDAEYVYYYDENGNQIME